MSDVVINLQVEDQTPLTLAVVNYDGVGPSGLSAYEIAVANGNFTGTEQEFAEALMRAYIGPTAPPTPFVNQLWVNTSL